MDPLRGGDTNNTTNSPQLPDLLNGTETNKDNRQEIDKINLLKGLGEFNSQLSNMQQNYNNTGSSAGKFVAFY